MIDHPRRDILKLEAVRFVAHLEGRSDATGFLLSSHPHGRLNTISVGGDSPNTIPIRIFLRASAFLHPSSSWPPQARLALASRTCDSSAAPLRFRVLQQNSRTVYSAIPRVSPASLCVKVFAETARDAT